jgi:hypothetical protein
MKNYKIHCDFCIKDLTKKVVYRLTVNTYRAGKKTSSGIFRPQTICWHCFKKIVAIKNKLLSKHFDYLNDAKYKILDTKKELKS